MPEVCAGCLKPLDPTGLCWPCCERRRRLSEASAVVDWAWLAHAEVGAHVHFNSGWPETSWGAELRGIVDDSVAVALRRHGRGRGEYFFITRIEAMVWMRGEGGAMLRAGDLPKDLRATRG